MYRFLTNLGAPAIAFYLMIRKARGREDPVRFAERFGFASLPRPEGKLVWCHAASVGEALSVLSLIRAIRMLYPQWRLLLTTGTVSSAQMLPSRLPEGVFHQYVPVDRWPYVRLFLDHWRPDLALWVESELWPNMLEALQDRRIPAILLNGRMSARSFRKWRIFRGLAEDVLNAFHIVLAQTEADQKRFSMLGARETLCLGNLKYAADPLGCDEAELERLKGQIGKRPVWLMASTHPGEEAIAFQADRALRARWPDLLTIIVPRHPARGKSIEALAARQRLVCAQRSLQEPVTPATHVYLADTMGEMGLFYRLSPVTCLGGTFMWGGHNPIEPAQLGSAIVFGPRMSNFASIAEDFLARKAALQVHDPAYLAPLIGHFLSDPEAAAHCVKAARNLTKEKFCVLEKTVSRLAPWFDLPSDP